MSKIWSGPAAGADARKDLMDEVGDLCAFVNELGTRWEAIRNQTFGSVPLKCVDTPYYAVLPRELVEMLDDAGDILVCEDEGCLKPVHLDWDFCEDHGKAEDGDTEDD